MVRGAVLGVVILVVAGLFVSWAPSAAAGCDKSYPPCICTDIRDRSTCTPGLVTIKNVNFYAYMAKDETSGRGSVVFQFAWATEDPSKVASVPFDIELVSTEEVRFRDSDGMAYTHSNDTFASSVEVLQAFTYEGDAGDIEVAFTLIAHQGTPEEERVEGRVGFNEHGTGIDDPPGGMTVTQAALLSGILGFILGAIIAAIVMLSRRRD